jgi:hypothetical protein
VLPQKIHRVRQLEHPLSVAALQVALLIAHAENDRIPALRDSLSLRRFEVDRACESRIRGQQDDLVPFIALLAKIPFRGFTQRGRPAAQLMD